jgi:hypothetical protein
LRSSASPALRGAAAPRRALVRVRSRRHFFAMEAPDLFVGDVRAFFAGLR